MLRKCTLLAAISLIATSALAEDVDLDVIHRIKDEAFNHSRVMDYVFELADLNGPRLSGSPGHRQAAETAARILREHGIRDAATEVWGTFGRSWSHSATSVRMLSPTVTPLSAVPMAWSAGTNGKVQGAAVYAPLFEDPDSPGFSDLELAMRQIADYRDRYAGKLRGKIVLIDPPRSFELPTEAPLSRFEQADLDELSIGDTRKFAATVAWPLLRLPEDSDEGDEFLGSISLEVEAEFWERQLTVVNRFHKLLREEGIAAVLRVDDRGDGGAIFSDSYGSWHPDTAVAPTTLTLHPEQYNRIARLVERGVPVEVEIDVAAEFHAEDADGVNVIANLPGGRKRNEIVMLGGHLDSWHAATGASDNAAGCAVAMEVMRILKSLNLELDRTVRLGLWDGEEQNYYGSRAYVRANFADPVSMQLEPEHSRLSAYYNLDNGGGKIRGVYLQNNDMARPIFEAWFAPFADLGATTVATSSTLFTDHRAFDSVGLPGFQFVQDPLEYDTRTHHSDLDTVDHLQPDDLKQAAAVLATIVYHTANRAELMPRKQLPPPLPEKQKVPALLAN